MKKNAIWLSVAGSLIMDKTGKLQFYIFHKAFSSWKKNMCHNIEMICHRTYFVLVYIFTADMTNTMLLLNMSFTKYAILQLILFSYTGYTKKKLRLFRKLSSDMTQFLHILPHKPEKQAYQFEVIHK